MGSLTVKLPGAFFNTLIFHLLSVGGKKFLASSISLWLTLWSFYHRAMKNFILMEIHCQIWKNTFLILHRQYSPCPGFFTWRSGYQLDFCHKCTEFLIADLSQVNICHVTNSFQNLELFNKLQHEEEQSVIYRNWVLMYIYWCFNRTMCKKSCYFFI